MTPFRTSDFEYDLPEGRIARYPVERRDESRLLVVRRAARGAGTGGDEVGGREETGGQREAGSGEPVLEDLRFRDLPRLVAPGDALVLNDSRVFPARLRGHKPTGAAVEVFLLRPVPDGGAEPRQPSPDGGAGDGSETTGPDVTSARRWEALVRPGSKLKPGREVVVADELRIHVEDSTESGGRIVRLEGEGDPWTLVLRHGRTPIPPYLDRESEPLDRERYQTVYASRTGSVAAPTAGLHFTRDLLGELESRGVRPVRVTLHVGIGTFRPVEAERPSDHELHAEAYSVSESAAATLNAVRAEGGAIWSVGTTSARTLETVVDEEGRFRAGSGTTDLFIRPPHRFRGVDRLLTNFHLPRSSLLMLVAAFAGHDLTMRAYRHAVEAGYRFYSYGDAMAVL